MLKDAFIECLYYYTLPEFSNNCKIVNTNTLLVRDSLLANPTNPHINFGGQYDPHYEHPSGPQYLVCHKPVRRKIKKISDNKSYSEAYLLFLTTRPLLNRDKQHCISGFYHLDLGNVALDPEYKQPVLYAKNAKFVDVQDVIDVSGFLDKYNYYMTPFSTETKNGSHRQQLEDWVTALRKCDNKLGAYIDLTKRLEQIFNYFEYEKGIYPVCKGCTGSERCYLVKRIKKNGKIFDQLPEDISKIINDYYKSNSLMNCDS
jgi:hypothetical protein